MHPLVVHLPIGFLLLAGIFFFLGRNEKYAFLHKALPVTFLLSALSAITAAVFGWLLARNGGYADTTLFWHKWLGISVAAFSGIAYWQSTGNRKTPVWLLALSITLLGITGHLGGVLTHGEDYLTEPLRANVKSEKKALPHQLDSIDLYAHLVQPVFEKKCYACHNDTKQNGGLNMANWEAFQMGGDGGKVFAHEAYESELFHRVTLAQSSKKFMPPKGEPLSFGEINILKWWLENGAKSEIKLSALNIPEEIKSTLLHDYGLDVNPKPFVETVQIDALPESVLTELESAGWRVSILAQTNNLLEVSPEAKVTSEAMNALLKAKEHITWLDLSNSELMDNDLEALSQFSNLSRLRLEKNNISDAGLSHLTELKNLESLNLYGNPITDAGLIHLEQLPALKKVFLWQTAVTEAGKTNLKDVKADLELM